MTQRERRLIVLLSWAVSLAIMAVGTWGCGIKLPPVVEPKPKECPASCPLGTACTDPAKGCEPVPAPDPGACVIGRDWCGCYVMPPETGKWELAECGPGQVCTSERQCVAGPVTPPASCPETCPAGQHCTDPAVGCVKDPEPPAAGCTLAGEPTEAVPGQANTLGSAVNAAMAALRPDCAPGGTCLLGDLPLQQWQAQVEAELRELGHCAGQHTPSTDEIAVAETATAPWQGFHVAAGDDSAGPVPPGKPRRTVVWSPAAYRGAWKAPGAVVPPASTCPAEPCPPKTWPDGSPHWSWNAKPHTMGNCDSTPVVRRAWDYCKAVGLGWMDDAQTVPRGDCPVRPDGNPDRSAVEFWLLGGAPVRDGRAGQDCTPNHTDNPMAFLNGTGNCRVCNADRTVCSGWF